MFMFETLKMIAEGIALFGFAIGFILCLSASNKRFPKLSTIQWVKVTITFLMAYGVVLLITYVILHKMYGATILQVYFVTGLLYFVLGLGMVQEANKKLQQGR